MALTPITSAAAMPLAAQGGTRTWQSKLITYPFSAAFLKKIAMIVTLVLVAGVALTIIDIFMQKRYDDYQPDFIPPKGPRARNGPEQKKEYINRRFVRPPLPKLPEGPIDSILSDKQRAELISKINDLEAPVGIKNLSNDCFLNSTLQYIVHSNLLEFFLNPKNLDQRFLSTEQRSDTFYRLLVWFAQNYANENQDQLRTDYFRRLIPNDEWKQGQDPKCQFFPEGVFGDSNQALSAFMSFYQIEPIAQVLSKEKFVKLDGEYIPFDEKSTDPLPMVYLPFPSSLDPSISTSPHPSLPLRNLWQSTSEIVPINEFYLKSSVLVDKPDLFILAKRFIVDPNNPNLPYTKNNSYIDFEGKSIVCQNERYYELSAMIKHIGKTPHGYHYVSYVKKNGHWFCIDDSIVKLEPQPLEQAKKCYQFYFKQITRERRGSDSSTGSIDSDEERTPRYGAIELSSGCNHLLEFDRSSSEGSAPVQDAGSEKTDSASDGSPVQSPERID